MKRPIHVRRPGTFLLATSLAFFAFAGVANAHAELEDPTPNRNAEVEGTPPEISGIYSEAMEPDGSSLKLVDAAGAELAEGGVDPANDLRMVISPVPELTPGDYTVESTTVSAADGDVDRATWRFTVIAAPTPEPTATPTPTASPPPPTASATATPTASPAPSVSASPTPAASGDGGGTTGGGSDVLLPILAAAAIVAVLGGVLYSRRDRSSTPS